MMLAETYKVFNNCLRGRGELLMYFPSAECVYRN